MGRELAGDLSNRGELAAIIALPPDRSAVLIGVREALLAAYSSAIAAVFAACDIRARTERRSGTLCHTAIVSGNPRSATATDTSPRLSLKRCAAT
jgi:hypothetical protein